MRIGEAVAVMVGDLDVDRQAIVVARSLKDDGSLGSTKRRIIPTLSPARLL